ncbi:MAG TPA: outer membrane beta-barrel protein, partial [Gammaproteobacteria bacterium]|nr:outer membrane beta-barrel protein [Gammaproteobacteria bacterium]
AVPQAFLQLQHHQYGVKAGLLLTLAGIELYESPKDFNFSRSILDGYAQPGSHLGIRGVDNWNDHLSLILGVGNGWSTIRQPYKQNHFECGINYNAPHIFNILVNGYSGLQYLTDRAGSGPTSRRNLLDIFGTLYITEKLNLAANYDYAMQNQAALANGSIGKATWQGIAGYINYQWAEKWLTSLRSEILADTQGYRTGVRQNWREITLTLRYFPVKALEFRAETRHDFSNVNAFRSKSGTAAYNNQQSFGLEGIYNF